MTATTIEQSRQLLELGIDPSTADMWYIPSYTDENDNDLFTLEVRAEIFIEEGEGIPAWSLGALLEILDDVITDEHGNDYYLGIVKDNSQYQLYYHDYWGNLEDIETDFHDYMIGACYEIIVKLKEKNLL